MRIGSVFLPGLLFLAGCSAAETPERCVERFKKLLVGGPDLRPVRFQPTFTYDVSQMENVLEELVGEGEQRRRVRMTLSHGASGPALDAFYRSDVPPDGALFAADDLSLFRVRGSPGLRDETLVAGCRGAPAKSRLVHVHWRPVKPKEAETGRLL